MSAHVNAPILQVNDDFYEDLDYQTTSDLLESLEAGVPLPVDQFLTVRLEATEGATTLASIKIKKATARAIKGVLPTLNDADRFLQIFTVGAYQ